MNLTTSEIQAIREEAAHYEQASAAAIEALKIVQARRGWVSDESLADIAALLGMSPAQLDGVATFYNLIYRRPVGRKVIHYCNSVSCWMLGSEENREYLQQRLGIGLGETTADGEYTLLPIVCLGACDKAPVMMIGEETHVSVDRAAIDRLVVGHEPRAIPVRDRAGVVATDFPHPNPLPDGEGEQDGRFATSTSLPTGGV